MKNKKAFTLVELLVVVAIIALLLSILLPALGKARETAKISACGSAEHQVFVAQNAYAAVNNGNFTPTTPAPPIGATGGVWSIWTTSAPDEGWFGTGKLLHQDYLEDAKVMYCPAWTNPNYSYDNPLYGWRDGTPRKMGGAQWLAQSYHYRGTIGRKTKITPKGSTYGRQVNILRDNTSIALLVDGFTYLPSGLVPEPAVRECHKIGYNVLYLDGSVNFYNDDRKEVDAAVLSNNAVGNAGWDAQELIWMTHFDQFVHEGTIETGGGGGGR